MSRVRVTWNDQKFIADSTEALSEALFSGTTVGADAASRSMRGLQRGSSSSPGTPPNMQTGHLARSIESVHPRQYGRGPLVSAYGTGVFYGRVLETGATIRASGKKLTVPINPKAKRKAQIPGWSPRNEPGLFVLKAPSGAYLAKSVGGKNARVEIWFKLMESVRVAARPWLVPSFYKNRPRIESTMRTTLAKELQRRGWGRG